MGMATAGGGGWILQIPDVHDNVRYDGLHNAHLDLDGLPELYELAKHLADSIVPQEYGVSKRYSLVQWVGIRCIGHSQEDRLTAKRVQ